MPKAPPSRLSSSFRRPTSAALALRCLSAATFFSIPFAARADDSGSSNSPAAAGAANPPPPAGNSSPAREPIPPAEPPSSVPGGAPGEAAEEKKDSFKTGAELFYGTSNLPSAHRFRDGFYIGYGPAYPSVVYGRWEGRDSSAAKISVGLGKLNNGSVANVDQPVEAWYQRPTRAGSLTAGKFYVPFAIQEWEYETKWGLMLGGKVHKADFTTATNYNRTTQSLNVYGRIAQSFGNLTLGLSLGGGRGFSYDTVHDRGVGLDASYNWRGWQFNSEYVVLQRRATERFQFAFGKLAYTRLGRLTPFVSRHSWFDRAGQLGNYTGNTIGMAYRLAPGLNLEGAYAHAPSQRVRWLQLHYTVER